MNAVLLSAPTLSLAVVQPGSCLLLTTTLPNSPHPRHTHTLHNYTQENPYIKMWADALAEAGFHVVVPDLVRGKIWPYKTLDSSNWMVGQSATSPALTLSLLHTPHFLLATVLQYLEDWVFGFPEDDILRDCDAAMLFVRQQVAAAAAATTAGAAATTDATSTATPTGGAGGGAGADSSGDSSGPLDSLTLSAIPCSFVGFCFGGRVAQELGCRNLAAASTNAAAATPTSTADSAASPRARKRQRSSARQATTKAHQVCHPELGQCTGHALTMALCLVLVRWACVCVCVLCAAAGGATRSNVYHGGSRLLHQNA